MSAGSAVKHVTRGIPSDVPVPRNITIAFVFAFDIVSGYYSKRRTRPTRRLFLTIDANPSVEIP